MGDVPPRLGSKPTEQELRILRHIADGWTIAEIGEAMHLSAMTVKRSARRLSLRLGARNRPHTVALAFRRGHLKVTDWAVADE